MTLTIALGVSLGAASGAASQAPASTTASTSRTIPDNAYGAMRWRLVGPFRGGRTLAVEGIAGDPATFYFGGVAGGVWRTQNAGATWEPLTDDQPFASIGALALAPSDPATIYVGTGEADMRSDITYGDGMWKSTDAGRHWAHIGLDSTRQIGRILVDPHDPNVVIVAALGHAYGSSADRGVFRSTDGGQSWHKTLYRDERTGAIDLAFDPTDPHVVYAALWEARRPPSSQYPPNEGPGSGLFKSTDEGETWTAISGHGLPDGPLGRIGLAVARGSAGAIVYAVCEEAKQGSGLYRSDDGGGTWRLTGADPRMGRGWYFGQVFVDPTNADVVYVPDVAILKSSDAGRTFSALKGAPGGDDYHYVWIDPTNARHLAFASDQGAGVSLDGGATWSDWFNQPTGQFYHVVTDHRWPYWIYGAQQDAGSVAAASRSDFGTLTYRDWILPGAGESGAIAVDPRDSNVVYGGNTYGGLLRFDRTTNQTQDIAPWPRDVFDQPIRKRRYRFTWTSPLVFDPIDTRALYFGAQWLLRTTDGGVTWERASPDLTASDSAVIYTVAPSPVREGVIWVGTDNGVIQLTTDRGTRWRNVTPPSITPWSKVSIIDASPFDAATAYAAVDRHRLDDIAPYIYRTHDAGGHWTRADQGIPAGAYVRAVRADPVRRGLLYAGTERGVYVSFDDGDHWQSLQLNLPQSPVHDLVVHGNDLIVATHGRAFWVLDDLSPLRQVTPATIGAEARLLRPATAIRVRRSENLDTPLPVETPHGDNPPAGAIIDYWLRSRPTGPVAIDILDARGAIVRHFASDQPADDSRVVAPRPLPAFSPDWLPRPAAPSADAGLNRFVWDLRYVRPPASSYEFSIAAIPGHGTVADPEGPLVVPGAYRVRLTVGATSQSQPLRVVLDPRVHVTAGVLQAQFDVAAQIWTAMSEADALDRAVGALRQSVAGRRTPSGPSAADSVATLLDSALAALHPAAISGGLARLESMVESADRPPTAPVRAALDDYRADLRRARARWTVIVRTELAALNARLRASGAGAIEAPSVAPQRLAGAPQSPPAVSAR
jgi:photosystem II stability/assembly factor-like uncharacterized protein